jgi:hypothetical protein
MRGYALKPGYSWNPLLSYPRNHPCFCMSGRKFKQCHLKNILPVCSLIDLPKLRSAVERAKAGLLVHIQIQKEAS